jgi:putative membrane protein
MRKFLIQWLITALALAVASRLVSGIQFTSLTTLGISALVLGFMNAIVRPILVVLTLPITILSLGIFYLVVNGAALALAATLVPGFRVASFGSAVLGAFLVSVFSWILGGLLMPRGE